MKLEIEVSENAFSSLRRGPEQFARELTLAACVKWYELGRITQAKAAEIACISRAEFIDALREYEVAAIQVSTRELEHEVAV
jgi:predicted HTH domain antitoxin